MAPRKPRARIIADEVRQELRAILRDVDRELNLAIGGAVMAAEEILYPCRPLVPGTTIDDARSQLRRILEKTKIMQSQLARARRLLAAKRR